MPAQFSINHLPQQPTASFLSKRTMMDRVIVSSLTFSKTMPSASRAATPLKYSTPAKNKIGMMTSPTRGKTASKHNPTPARGASTNSEVDLKQALALLTKGTEDWTDCIQGLEAWKSLARTAPEKLIIHVPDMVKGLVSWAKSLRSGQARAAITAIGEIVSVPQLSKEMTKEHFTAIIGVLIHRSGNEQGFMQKASDTALASVCQAQPQRALSCLARLYSNQSKHIRMSVAMAMTSAYEHVPKNSQIDAGELCAQMTAITHFAHDALPETRLAGRRLVDFVNAKCDPEVLRRAGREMRWEDWQAYEKLLAGPETASKGAGAVSRLGGATPGKARILNGGKTPGKSAAKPVARAQPIAEEAEEPQETKISAFSVEPTLSIMESQSQSQNGSGSTIELLADSFPPIDFSAAETSDRNLDMPVLPVLAAVAEAEKQRKISEGNASNASGTRSARSSLKSTGKRSFERISAPAAADTAMEVDPPAQPPVPKSARRSKEPQPQQQKDTAMDTKPDSVPVVTAPAEPQPPVQQPAAVAPVPDRSKVAISSLSRLSDVHSMGMLLRAVETKKPAAEEAGEAEKKTVAPTAEDDDEASVRKSLQFDATEEEDSSDMPQPAPTPTAAASAATPAVSATPGVKLLGKDDVRQAFMHQPLSDLGMVKNALLKQVEVLTKLKEQSKGRPLDLAAYFPDNWRKVVAQDPILPALAAARKENFRY